MGKTSRRNRNKTGRTQSMRIDNKSYIYYNSENEGLYIQSYDEWVNTGTRAKSKLATSLITAYTNYVILIKRDHDTDTDFTYDDVMDVSTLNQRDTNIRKNSTSKRDKMYF
jgi:hypothetical protein